jgi:hypothetical protein
MIPAIATHPTAIPSKERCIPSVAMLFLALGTDLSIASYRQLAGRYPKKELWACQLGLSEYMVLASRTVRVRQLATKA